MQEGGNRVGEPAKYKRGDVAKGFAEADVVLEETYRTPCEIHTPMEVHGSVAQWDGDRLMVWDTNQGSSTVRAARAVASTAAEQGPGHLHYMGGGFGSKLNLGKYTVIAALLARKTARPVKLFLTREETFLAVGNRPAHIMKLKAGVKKDGTLTALAVDRARRGRGLPGRHQRRLPGRRPVQVPERARPRSEASHQCRPDRAFRAPGFPQCSWALEQMMDALAEKIGMDPVELRLKNFPTVCQRPRNKPYTSAGLRECLHGGRGGLRLEGGAQAAERTGPVGARRGRGRRDVGLRSGPPSTVVVQLLPDGSVNLNMGAADLGTGTKTVMAMVVAEELGVPLDRSRSRTPTPGPPNSPVPAAAARPSSPIRRRCARRRSR